MQMRRSAVPYYFCLAVYSTHVRSATAWPPCRSAKWLPVRQDQTISTGPTTCQPSFVVAQKFTFNKAIDRLKYFCHTQCPPIPGPPCHATLFTTGQLCNCQHSCNCVVVWKINNADGHWLFWGLSIAFDTSCQATHSCKVGHCWPVYPPYWSAKLTARLMVLGHQHHSGRSDQFHHVYLH
jgi:hypothetical protein